MWTEAAVALTVLGGIAVIITGVTIALMWAFHKFL